MLRDRKYAIRCRLYGTGHVHSPFSGGACRPGLPQPCWHVGNAYVNIVTGQVSAIAATIAIGLLADTGAIPRLDSMAPTAMDDCDDGDLDKPRTQASIPSRLSFQWL